MIGRSLWLVQFTRVGITAARMFRTAIGGSRALRVPGMKASNLNVPLTAALWVFEQKGKDRRSIGPHVIAKLLGVAAGEVGVAIRLQKRVG